MSDIKHTVESAPSASVPIPENLAAYLAIGQQLAQPHSLGAGAFAILPEDTVALDLEKFMPQPVRIRQQVNLSRLGDWIEYVNLFKGPSTRIYRHGEFGFVAKIDDHLPGKPSWNDHWATLSPSTSPRFASWRNSNSKWVSQTDFAEFVSDNLPYFAKPTGAEMLELAQHMRATTSVEWESSQLLSNGQVKLNYSETIKASCGEKGFVEIPQKFSVGVQILKGEVKYLLEARLRYRIQDKKLVFRYDLDSLDALLERVQEDQEQIVKDKTGLQVLA